MEMWQILGSNGGENDMAFVNVVETTSSRMREQNISEVCHEQAVLKSSVSRLVEAATLIEHAAYDLAKINDTNCIATLLLQSAAIERIVKGLNSKLI